MLLLNMHINEEMLQFVGLDQQTALCPRLHFPVGSFVEI